MPHGPGRDDPAPNSRPYRATDPHDAAEVVPKFPRPDAAADAVSRAALVREG